MQPKFYFVLRQVLCLFITALTITTTFGQSAKKLDSLFTTLSKQGTINGCVLVAEDGKPVYEKAFGYANFDTKQLLTNQTMFELASVSKQFTAMAIMQLHQQGKLAYTDVLDKFFPSIPYYGITINNLLHHTSGLPDFLTWDEKLVDVHRINYNKDILAVLMRKAVPLDFKTGDELRYSNTNYVLLALIVEKVSGMPFADYMDKYIFKPLDMQRTKVYPQRAAKQKMHDYAFGYIYNPVKGGFVINDSITANKYAYYFDGVAGPYGISSCTEDMLKWDQALYTEKLVSKQEQAMAYVISKLNNGEPAMWTGLGYGFGWLIPPANDETGQFYLHSGSYPGYMTMIVRYPEKKKTVVFLTNTGHVIDLYELSESVENILFNQPFDIPEATPFKKIVILNPVQLKAVEGSYAFKDAPQIKVIITNENSQVFAQVTGQGKMEIYPEAETDFFYTVADAKIHVDKDNTGKITKMTFLKSGQKMEANRE